MKWHRWPVGIVIFFLFIALLNTGLIVAAVSGYGGLLDEQPYEKGLAYDTQHAELTNFIQSGWRIALRTKPLEVHIADSIGLPVKNGQVTVYAIRPNDKTKDAVNVMNETSAGTYAASHSLDDGRWLLNIFVEHQGNKYRANRSVLAQAGSEITINGDKP